MTAGAIAIAAVLIVWTLVYYAEEAANGLAGVWRVLRDLFRRDQP